LRSSLEYFTNHMLQISFFSSATRLIMACCAICIIASFSSCEKTVSINLSSTPPALVVEGSIESGFPPYVVLTNSIGFFDSVNLATVTSSFVHGATITVADGSTVVNLKEITIDSGSNKLSFYTVDNTDPMAANFKGQIDHYYKLTIVYNGKTYTSTTKIPNPKGVDSVWSGKITDSTNQRLLNARTLYYNYTDPDTPGDYVRYYTKKSHEFLYKPGRYVFNDQVVNGVTITNQSLPPGTDGSTDTTKDHLSRYFFVGDTVNLKWSNIDKSTYTFWTTLAFALNSVGNPFSSPINAQSNISNGALGIWAGYGSKNYTIYIQ